MFSLNAERVGRITGNTYFFSIRIGKANIQTIFIALFYLKLEREDRITFITYFFIIRIEKANIQTIFILVFSIKNRNSRLLTSSEQMYTL